MPPYKLLNLVLSLQKLSPGGSRFLQIARSSSSMTLTEPVPSATPERKLLKVAIIGRPNAGKSTLINKILKLNICGVSHKSHTTRSIFRASFTENNTQIVFMDTPGLITNKECTRFKLSNDFFKASSEEFINEVDIIGIVHEVHEPRDIFKFPLCLIQQINNLPETKPLFLILNKVDLIIDKTALTSAMILFKGECETEQKPENVTKPKILEKFSEIFFTSAIQNKGVKEIVNYLLQQAKPGDWLFKPDEVHNTPLTSLILELLRANFMDNFPQEVPYYCTYEIEYLKENDLGEIICVGLITCRYAKHVALITSKKKKALRILCRTFVITLSSGEESTLSTIEKSIISTICCPSALISDLLHSPIEHKVPRRILDVIVLGSSKTDDAKITEAARATKFAAYKQPHLLKKPQNKLRSGCPQVFSFSPQIDYRKFVGEI